jgi:hypothetical protein
MCGVNTFSVFIVAYTSMSHYFGDPKEGESGCEGGIKQHVLSRCGLQSSGKKR